MYLVFKFFPPRNKPNLKWKWLETNPAISKFMDSSYVEFGNTPSKSWVFSTNHLHTQGFCRSPNGSLAVSLVFANLRELRWDWGQRWADQGLGDTGQTAGICQAQNQQGGSLRAMYLKMRWMQGGAESCYFWSFSHTP